MKNEFIGQLNSYFETRKDVSFAYLFGSTVSGNTHSESDVDIGVYFTPKTSGLEYESEVQYPEENKIWSDLEEITGKNTDMVVLNRAPATLFYSVLKTGEKIFSRDENLLSRLYLCVSMAAEDFRYFVSDFVKIKARSNSLSDIDKDRLIRMVDFLEMELNDFEKFKKVDQIQYTEDITTKRNIERWVENIVNSSVDIAKIIIASEKRHIPDTYKSIVLSLGTIEGFDPDIAFALSEFSKMRNMLAHEYLDIRFVQIKEFIKKSESAYKYLVDFIKNYIK